MTWLDYTIIAIFVIATGLGLRMGAVNLMLHGAVRSVWTNWLALTGVLVTVASIGAGTLDILWLGLGLFVLYSALWHIAYRVFGWLQEPAALAIERHVWGPTINRLMGIPAGLFVGYCAVMLLVILPAVHVRGALPATVAPPDYVRESKLAPEFVPAAEQTVAFVSQAWTAAVMK